jgi:hypothetical protein
MLGTFSVCTVDVVVVVVVIVVGFFILYTHHYIIIAYLHYLHLVQIIVVH